MPSLKCRLFVFALKYRHLMQFQWKRRSFVTFETSIPKLREEIERGAGFFGKLPTGTEVTPVEIGALHAEWVRPADAPKDTAILYFHGGGYATGSCKAHRGIVAKFANGSSTNALVFDYRLAPEHPFPGALDDAVAAYRWLLSEGFAPRKIAFIGDSAGGGLALATLLAIRDQGLPLPAGAVALSPWTDLKNSGDSLKTNAQVDTLCWKEAQTVFSKYYAGDNDPGNPWISPLYGDLHGLPPIRIYVGGSELLLDDSTRFAKRAAEAGVDIKLTVGEGLFHCYPACAPLFPEATQGMREICAFVKECLGNPQ
ncbi:MAG: alpha/beta hydrolase [Candidatus Hydrogenedentales bacterium]